MDRRKFLAAFDFDHTVVSGNTDLVAMELLGDNTPDVNKYSEISYPNGWVSYMQYIFEMLRDHNISEHTIREAMRNVPANPGMITLIKTMHDDHDFDIIIISDANTLFIDTWLAANGLTDYVKRVFSHKAEFSADDGSLRIKPHEVRSTCPLSMGSINICKGKVLKDFIAECRSNEALVYLSVYYVGDGSNDVCPVMRLGKQDFACPRAGFKLDMYIKNLEKISSEATNDQTSDNVDSEQLLPKATVLRWKHGDELLELILPSIPAKDVEFHRERHHALVL